MLLSSLLVVWWRRGLHLRMPVCFNPSFPLNISGIAFNILNKGSAVIWVRCNPDSIYAREENQKYGQSVSLALLWRNVNNKHCLWYFILLFLFLVFLALVCSKHSEVTQFPCQKNCQKEVSSAFSSCHKGKAWELWKTAGGRMVNTLPSSQIFFFILICNQLHMHALDTYLNQGESLANYEKFSHCSKML